MPKKKFLHRQRVMCVYIKSKWFGRNDTDNVILPEYHKEYTVEKEQNGSLVLKEIPEMVFSTDAFKELPLDKNFVQKLIESL